MSGIATGKARAPSMAIKVYLVCQRLNLVAPGGPNVVILDARLTRGSAQSIVDNAPGTFIVKKTATK